MEKRLKLRIYRVITTTLQSCRSKDPSDLPQDPVPSFSRLSTIDHFPPPKDFQNHRTSFKHHVSSAIISIGCDLPYADEPSNDHRTGSLPPGFTWQKEDKWHVVAKIYENRPKPRRKIYTSSASDDELTFAPPHPPPSATEVARNRRDKRNKKKKNLPSRIRISTSSAEIGWFSSDGGAADDDEETETLVSSSISCLSTGSSSEQLPPIRESHPLTTDFPCRRSANKRRSNAANHRQRRNGAEKANSAPDEDAPARLSMFKKLIPCTVDGKVKESFAIVKRSSNPYQDFKDSMKDMIVEKQIFEAEDLEQLLQCFLSLNSRQYHGVIVEAFSEIWEAIFYPRAQAQPGGFKI